MQHQHRDVRAYGKDDDGDGKLRHLVAYNPPRDRPMHMRLSHHPIRMLITQRHPHKLGGSRASSSEHAGLLTRD